MRVPWPDGYLVVLYKGEEWLRIPVFTTLLLWGIGGSLVFALTR